MTADLDPTTADAAAIQAALYELDAAQLAQAIERGNREYWAELAPSLPDPLYDRLVERLRLLEPEHPVLEALGEGAGQGPALSEERAQAVPPAERFGAAVVHAAAMLSLQKAYTPAEYQAWAASFEGPVLVMPKFDGLACSLRYDARGELWLAATRGSGTEGEDVTRNVLQIPGVPARIASAGAPLEVRGEVYMRTSKFAPYAAQFANPRNFTAGALRQKDLVDTRLQDLSFAAYDLLGVDVADEAEKFARLEQLGLPTAEHAVIAASEGPSAFAEWAARRAGLDYEIDGVVFRTAWRREQQRLGSTSHHPRWAVAYKFQGDAGETTLLDVQWSIGSTGVITPVAILEPVELSGAMVGRANLHNLGYFRRLGLTRGATVEVVRRGGVIPHVERMVRPGPGSEPFAVPDTCPATGGPVAERVRTTKEKGGELKRVETLVSLGFRGSEAARLKELEHFARVVDFQGFGEKFLAEAFKSGLVEGPADLYRLELAKLVELPRLAAKSAQNLLDEAERHRELALATFLESLRIDDLGAQTARGLAAHFGTLAAIQTALAGLAATELEDPAADPAEAREHPFVVKGITGPTTGPRIAAGLLARAELIDELLQEVRVLDANPTEDPTNAAADAAEHAPLRGRSFVFTGTLEGMNRKAAQAAVRARGGTTPDDVTAELTDLVIGRGKGPKSSKQKKAEALLAKGAALRILSEDEFEALLASHPLAPG